MDLRNSLIPGKTKEELEAGEEPTKPGGWDAPHPLVGDSLGPSVGPGQYTEEPKIESVEVTDSVATSVETEEEFSEEDL